MHAEEKLANTKEVNLLDDQVAIRLHSDTPHIIALLCGVLPGCVAVFIGHNFTVVLHSELVDAVLTPQTLAWEQPLIGAKCVVRHILYDLGGREGGLKSWLDVFRN